MSVGPRSSGVFTTDLALVVQSWDPWLAEATGVAEASALGRPLGELFPELAERGTLERLREVVRTGAVAVLAPVFHQYLIPAAPRTPSSSFARMQQHVTIAPVRAGDTIVGAAVTIEDVTARLDRERELAAQLKSPDDAVRLAAARAIAEGEGSAAPLGAALGDASWQVRRAAAEGLARGDEDSVATLVATLRDRHRDPAALNAALGAIARSRADVLPQLVALLASSADADLRTYVSLALGLLGDRRAVAPLVGALGDADPNVRFHAIEALGRIGAREAAPALAAVAESRDFSVAFAALDALALIGEPSVAPQLVPLLDDELLQPAAAAALGRIASEELVGPLAALLAQAGAPTLAGAGALASLHDRLEADHGEGELVADLARAVIPAAGARNVIDTIGSADTESLPSLALVLSWLDAEGVDQTLATLLGWPRLRRMICELLGRRGTRAVAALVDALAAEDVETRKAAASALGRIGAPRAVPPLVAALDDEPEVAVVAAGALGSIGDAQAFEPLLAHLDHPQAAVRQAVVAALNSIGDARMPARVAVLLADPSPQRREGAAKIAGYFGWPECADALLALRDDPDDTVRRAAVEQLCHVDDPRAHRPAAAALPLLVGATSDSDPWVRYYAARSIGRQARRDALPTLVALAKGDPVPPVRIAAVDAIAAIGEITGDAAATLVALADDPDEMVAQQALVALGAARGAETMAPLLAALAGRSRERRRAAMAALVERREERAVAPLADLARTTRDAELAASAVVAIGAIGSEAAIASLVSLADEPRLVSAAVAALASQGEDRVAVVGRGLAHAEVGVRCAVVEALGRMRHRAAATLVAGALEDPAPAVRLAAVHALGRKDLRDTAPGLAALVTGDADATVRRAAQRALAR